MDPDVPRRPGMRRTRIVSLRITPVTGSVHFKKDSTSDQAEKP